MWSTGPRGHGGTAKNGLIEFYSKQAIIISKCGLQALGCTLCGRGGGQALEGMGAQRKMVRSNFNQNKPHVLVCGLQALWCTLSAYLCIKNQMDVAIHMDERQLDITHFHGNKYIDLYSRQKNMSCQSTSLEPGESVNL